VTPLPIAGGVGADEEARGGGGALCGPIKGSLIAILMGYLKTSSRTLDTIYEEH